MPTCGRCKATDVSTASVRACYNGQPNPHAVNEEALAAERLRSLVASVPRAEDDNSPMWPASDSQINYLVNILQDERRLPDTYKVLSEDDCRKMERDEVSSQITILKTFPYKNGKAATDSKWSMPEGRYALHVNGEVWFFEVNKPTQGRWKGYTFIKRLIGSPGAYRKLPMQAGERNKYLAKIDADPKAAAILFGKESKTCFRCHSPLTDPDSLARSMGPVCAGKVGW